MTSRRCGLTLVEILVSLAIFVSLIAIATFVHNNVSAATERTLTLLQLHHEGTAIMQRLREDLANSQPQTAMHLADHHITFMSSHGQGLSSEQSHGGVPSGYYAHDLTWVRWQWDRQGLRRAASPIIPMGTATVGIANHDHRKHMGGSNRAGTPAHPQQFFGYFQPPTLPDDSRDPDHITDIDAYRSTLEPLPGLDLPTMHFYRPAKLWWHPGHGQDRHRGTPGSILAVGQGGLTEESPDSGDLTSVSFVSTPSIAGDDASTGEFAFSLVNPSGHSANRDRLHLLGTHPDQAYGDYPSKLSLVSRQVTNMRIHLFADTWTPAGDRIARSGDLDSVLFTSSPDTPLTTGSYSGLPRTPSRAVPIGSTRIRPANANDPEASSAPFSQRPVRVEISFVMHDVDPAAVDELDRDNDGDRKEPRIRALIDMLGPDPDNETLKRHLEAEDQVAVVFTMAVALP